MRWISSGIPRVHACAELLQSDEILTRLRLDLMQGSMYLGVICVASLLMWDDKPRAAFYWKAWNGLSIAATIRAESPSWIPALLILRKRWEKFHTLRLGF